MFTYKKFIFSLALFGATAGCSTVFAQVVASSDLEQFSVEHPDFVRAYSLINIASTWKAVIDSGAALAPVKIGISDTGIDAGHPEFAGEIVGGNRIGVVDLGQTPPSSRKDSDAGGHGTQVAGIIGANNLSGLGHTPNVTQAQMNGVLSGVPLLSYSLDARQSGGRDAFLLISKIKSLADNNVKIVNISMGSDRPTNPALRFLWSFSSTQFRNTLAHFSDITFVVASGGFPEQDVENISPANAGDLPNVITVADTDLDDHRGFQTNFGSKVALSAPGLDVYSPAPRGKGNFPTDTKDYDQFFTGSSAAAPLVTGVAGLIKAIKPNFTPAEIKDILTKTENTDPVVPDPGKPIGRRLNALKAVCDARVLGNTSPGCVTTGTGTINGTVRHRPEDGGGVFPEANVYLLTSSTQEFVALTQTDTNGHYQFTAEAGTYNVVTDQYFIDGTGNCDQGSIPVTVSAGQTVVGDITLGFTPGGLCMPL